MPVLRAGAGLSPRRATHFLLLRQKKVSKEKATLSLRPLRGAKGQTCAVAVAGCAAELALRWRAPLGQPRRVRSRSTRAPTRVPPRNRPGAGAARRGGGQTTEQPHGSSLRSTLQRFCAVPALVTSAMRMRPRDGAERSNGPNGCTLPIPSVCAEERRAWGGVCRRTHASWTDSLRLFEQSAAGAQRVPQRAPRTSTTGCPVAKRRGRRQWGRPFFGDFLLATQKKVTRTPGDSRPPPSTEARRQTSRQAPARPPY